MIDDLTAIAWDYYYWSLARVLELETIYVFAAAIVATLIASFWAAYLEQLAVFGKALFIVVAGGLFFAAFIGIGHLTPVLVDVDAMARGQVSR